MRIISIVPRLPPAIDGVGDYALNLARKIRQSSSITTHFIVCDPMWNGESEIEGFPVSKVPSRLHGNLLSLAQESCGEIDNVLLHYVPHGYAKKACPFWLLNALEDWKHSNSHRRLITMFHELYAFGLPIINTGVQLERSGIRIVANSDFWLAPVQKSLTSRLACLSDRCLTSRQGYADVLLKLSGNKQKSISILSIPSNIGEPEEILPLAMRHRQLVIMGQQKNRLRVYQKAQTELKQICDTLEIERIIDIGPSIDLKQHSINGVPIVEMGRQSAAKISEVLSSSIAGFLSYNPSFLAKSGIFAAYCSHGVLPINYRGNISSVDGLIAGKHYWFPSRQFAVLDSLENFQTIANHAFKWYESHSLSIHAKVFVEQIAASK